MIMRVRGHNPSNGIVAVYGSTPTIGGAINIHEWSDAASVSINETEVLIKQDGVNLYIGFNVSDFTYINGIVLQFTSTWKMMVIHTCSLMMLRL